MKDDNLFIDNLFHRKNLRKRDARRHRASGVNSKQSDSGRNAPSKMSVDINTPILSTYISSNGSLSSSIEVDHCAKNPSKFLWPYNYLSGQKCLDSFLPSILINNSSCSDSYTFSLPPTGCLLSEQNNPNSTNLLAPVHFTIPSLFMNQNLISLYILVLILILRTYLL